MQKSFSPRRGLLCAALILSALSIAVLGLWAVPTTISPSTFAFIAVFMIGGAMVSLITWRNAQPTSTVGQLLEATEAGGTSRTLVPVAVRDGSK